MDPTIPVREAKAQGLPVTCEVTPHHLLLTDEICRSFDPNTKMNPPLRTQEDVDVLVRALEDGTIDCVATDHAPHAPVEKEGEFSCAPFGVVGLETAVSLLLDRLVKPGLLSLPRFIEVMSTNPCEILGLPGGKVAEGEPVEIVASVRNTTDAGLPMTMVIIGIPGGLEPRHEQLKESVKAGKFSFYEVRGREVAIYFRDMAPKAERTITISAVAAVPGVLRRIEWIRDFIARHS